MINKKEFMLCESIKEENLDLLDKSKYLANFKYDGERAITFILNNEVFMINRRGNLINSHFQEIEAELKKLPNCVLDGEIISYDDDFTKLQSRALTQNKEKQNLLLKSIPCRYMIFDILKFENEDLRNKPLKERIAFLEDFFSKFINRKAIDNKKDNELMLTTPIILVEYKPINEMLFNAKLEQKEGIIIKDMNSKYESRRSKSWLKLKFFNETTLILTSYKPNNAGFRCEDNFKNAVQVAGKQSLEVINRIKDKGSCEIFIQYLTKTENNKYRFISYRGLK